MSQGIQRKTLVFVGCPVVVLLCYPLDSFLLFPRFISLKLLFDTLCILL